MSTEVSRTDESALAHIVGLLEAAWNAGDGEGFAAPFTEDADFVNIRGQHARGRRAIAAGHAAIFRTIYAGSANRMTLEEARLPRPDVALVRVLATLDAPHGPLAGRHQARFTMILTREPEGWRIAVLHNTLVAPESSR